MYLGLTKPKKVPLEKAALDFLKAHGSRILFLRQSLRTDSARVPRCPQFLSRDLCCVPSCSPAPGRRRRAAGTRCRWRCRCSGSGRRSARASSRRSASTARCPGTSHTPPAPRPCPVGNPPSQCTGFSSSEEPLLNGGYLGLLGRPTAWPGDQAGRCFRRCQHPQLTAPSWEVKGPAPHKDGA